VNDLSLFEPSDLRQAMEISKTLSTSGLMPRALVGKPQDILVIIIKGRELGLSMMQSISGISVIQGKAVMEAATMVGLCLSKRDVCEYFRLITSDDKVATYVTKRSGSEPVTLSFTIEEAKKANLLGKDNWRNYPAAMLRARASSALARAVYPDLTAGIYDPDEIGAPSPGRGTQESVAAPTAAEKPRLSSGEMQLKAADVVIDVPRVVVEDDEVSAPEEPATGESSFKTEPEWSDEDPGEKQRIKEDMFKLATFRSGSLKGQFVEAAPISYIQQALRHMEKAKSPRPDDELFTDALRWWLARKEDAEWTGVK
jgi:hypothetical protein